ncbi:MAG: 16S rRNA (cytidine(1402)-2'-O)-methyltransferase [Syntrophales bacterium]|nr:16S rRNA (cytidine(1402)-2'-O)-methyltransferase [Syntrophales bacterium]
MGNGTLFIVATPIGNLEDITIRALRVLKDVDLIAAEDTRRTALLLRHYGIDKPLTSLHDHNERAKSASLISRLLEGSFIAYVSDAGTPGISDPGFLLIRQAIAKSIDIVTIPGPSSVIAALSISGIPMDSFTFQGFIPSKPVRRRQFLASLKEKSETLVFFESPRRVMSSLHDILEILGDREMTLSRELTKIHEETYRGRVASVMEALEEKNIKGEITMVLEGNREGPGMPSSDDVWTRFKSIVKDGTTSTRDGVNRVALETGMPKKAVYSIVLKHLET